MMTVMRRRARKSTWRKAATEAGRPRKLPHAVFIGLGVAMPIFLICAGLYAIGADSVKLPRFRVSAPHVAPATGGGGDYVLTGSGADGVGIDLIGIAIIIFSHFVLRRLPSAQKLAGPGIVAGILVTVGGVLFAILGG
jgi:hypothetical protein